MRPSTLFPLLLAICPATVPAAESQFRLKVAEPSAFRLEINQTTYRHTDSDSLKSALPYANLVEKSAHEHGLDPAFVHAVIKVESGYNAKAVSPKGAIGLMQLMPATAQQFGIRDAHDAAQNIEAGTALLARLQSVFNGRLDLVLAAYNAGEGAVQRHGNRIPPFRETLDYVPKVLARYRELNGGGKAGGRIDYWRAAKKHLEAAEAE